KGFDLNKLASPLEPHNILKENGRGVFILHSLMDEVKFDFSSGGTEVIITKYKNIS
ncbi:ATP-binding protein, partial [bacterium]|nr:ATP-binding protein [bacterium]